MPRTTCVALSLTVTLAALAGCGGGGSAQPTPHFAAIAETICENADLAIIGLPAEGTSLHSLALTASRELPIVRKELRELSVLVAPASQTMEFAAALSSTRRETEIIAKLVAAVRAGATSRIATLALRGNVVDGQAKAAMTALGLKGCARDVTPRSRG